MQISASQERSKHDDRNGSEINTRGSLFVTRLKLVKAFSFLLLLLLVLVLLVYPLFSIYAILQTQRALHVDLAGCNRTSLSLFFEGCAISSLNSSLILPLASLGGLCLQEQGISRQGFLASQSLLLLSPAKPKTNDLCPENLTPTP